MSKRYNDPLLARLESLDRGAAGQTTNRSYATPFAPPMAFANAAMTAPMPVTAAPAMTPAAMPSPSERVTRQLPVTGAQHALGGDGPSTLEGLDVSAWFGSRQVLDRCSLRMEANRVTALIGPSGCGKSTFLRILNRMHETIKGAKVAGSVQLDGVDIYGEDLGVTEVRLKIGMVFQKPNPFPSMSIRDNVLAGLKLAGLSHGDKDSLVEECLRGAGLWEEVRDRLHDGGMSLSGGQQQRLCIARSLAVRPRILLMDEPCSALDPISTRVVEETIGQLCDQVTIVIVTHNMQQAQRVSHECAFFLVEELGVPGKIVESGPTAKLFSDPDDQRTLDYVTGRFG